MRATPGQRQDEAAAAGASSTYSHELSQRLHLRPAEFVDPPARDAAVDGPRDRFGDVAGEDRLEAGLGAGERQHRQQRGRAPRSG